MASKPVMQFRAELVGAHIPIWRRFQVMNDVRFSKMAYILMTLFEMNGGHLFAFSIDVAGNIRRRPGDEVRNERLAQMFEEDGHGIVEIQFPLDENWIASAMEEMETPVMNATKEYVKWQLEHIGDECSFEYDFGDGWKVRLILEDVFEDDELPGKALPRVVEGDGYGIVEDCGGIQGLKELDQAFCRGRGPKYKEFSEWMGVNSFDLEYFDIGDMNFRIKKVPRIYRDMYEKGLVPTQRGMDILERRY